MFKVLSKIFPSKHEKDIKELLPIVDEINEYYEGLESLSDDELRAKTQEFKETIRQETEELENKITELKEKLKEDIAHEERIAVYDELDIAEKDLYETTEAVLSAF